MANKADLPGRVCVEDMDALCKRHEALIGWVATSAKTGTGVHEAIDQLIECARAETVKEDGKDNVIKLRKKQEEYDDFDKCC